MITSSQLIQAGMSLVPIPFGEKGPRTKDWNLRHNCINDIRLAHLLAGKNIGLAHAYSTPTPTCALDIDHYKHAKTWLAMHNIDLDLLIKAPDAVVIMSGKKYSLKLLYRLPAGTAPMESKKIIGPDGMSAIEFRCASKDGKTVQDVLPPSIHPQGQPYRWFGHGNPLQIPKIPSKLLSLWNLQITNGGRITKKMPTPPPVRHQRQESPREIANVSDELKKVSADCSYETWRNIVWAVLSTGWKCAEALARTWSKSAPHRYDENAFNLLISTYKQDTRNSISVGTIIFHARRGVQNV